MPIQSKLEKSAGCSMSRHDVNSQVPVSMARHEPTFFLPLHLVRFPSDPSPSTPKALASVDVVAPIDFCFCKFSFNGQAVSAADDFTRHCQGPATQMLMRRGGRPAAAAAGPRVLPLISCPTRHCQRPAPQMIKRHASGSVVPVLLGLQLLLLPGFLTLECCARCQQPVPPTPTREALSAARGVAAAARMLLGNPSTRSDPVHAAALLAVVPRPAHADAAMPGSAGGRDAPGRHLSAAGRLCLASLMAPSLGCRRQLYGRLFQYLIEESSARGMAWRPFEVQVRLEAGADETYWVCLSGERVPSAHAAARSPASTG